VYVYFSFCLFFLSLPASLSLSLSRTSALSLFLAVTCALSLFVSLTRARCLTLFLSLQGPSTASSSPSCKTTRESPRRTASSCDVTHSAVMQRTMMQHTTTTHYCNTLLHRHVMQRTLLQTPLQHTTATAHYCNTLRHHTPAATHYCNTTLLQYTTGGGRLTVRVTH